LPPDLPYLTRIVEFVCIGQSGCILSECP
jgi:hypothetical protein